MATKTAASVPLSPLHNQLLAALAAADYARISPNLEFAPLPLGMGLYEPGSRLGYVYFLTEGIVSLLYVLKNGASAEIAVTGCEGVGGVSLFMEQQLCRWLLLSFDRLPSNELIMTQELIANMLGVRREGVTEAAGILQQAGLIRYSRGHITLVDRPGLERRVCECYAVVKQESQRLSAYNRGGMLIRAPKPEAATQNSRPARRAPSSTPARPGGR